MSKMIEYRWEDESRWTGASADDFVAANHGDLEVADAVGRALANASAIVRLGGGAQPVMMIRSKAGARAEKRRLIRSAEDKVAAVMAETRATVATGVCPRCGSALRRNLSLTGWWQCEQLGAESHRARPGDPSCDWQGFTE